MLLRFFDANADGREPSRLHGPAHLNDATVASGPYRGRRFDLVGGWMDAGDMLHFTNTTAYAATLLQYAARLDPAHRAALRRHADVGVRWLVRAHPLPGLFVGQVGDVRDHDVGFRRPEGDDRSGRPGIARRLALPSRASDTTAKAAAALALAAERTSGQRRARLTREARAWYAAADGHRSLKPVLPGGFYAGTAFDDDLALAGATLHRLTGQARYLAWPRRFLAAWEPSTTGWTLSWDDTGALAAADLCGALGARPVGDAALRDLACERLGDAARGVATHAAASAFALTGGAHLGHHGDRRRRRRGGRARRAGGPGRRGCRAGRRRPRPPARPQPVGRRLRARLRRQRGPPPAPLGGRDPARRARRRRGRRPCPRQQVEGQVRDGGFEGVPAGAFDSPTWVYEGRTDDYVTSKPALDYVANTVLLQAVLAQAAGSGASTRSPRSA